MGTVTLDTKPLFVTLNVGNRVCMPGDILELSIDITA